jgi:carboxyl-terminal processing protease
MQVTKMKGLEDLSMVQPIKEFQLKNHLTTKASTTLEQNKNLNQLDRGNLSLAQQDFQLFEALKILKTLYLVEKH